MPVKNIKCDNFKILDEKAGSFQAAFATLNIRDLGGDVILPGAVKNGAPVRISAYNHSSWGGHLPVGKGIISEQGNSLLFDGAFFLDTWNGNETYKTIKNMGTLQEWSFGYDTLADEAGMLGDQRVNFLKELDIYEVSPVLLGEGIGTHTIDIKNLKTAIPPHKTPTVDKPWSAADNQKRLREDEKASYYKKMYAYFDPEGDTTKKSDYKFPHHEVGEKGEIGDANVRGCIAGIAALNGARGGSSVPDAERKGIWNHLAAHLKDADMEPAELKSISTEISGMKFVDHTEFVSEAIRELVSRSQAIEELREVEGKMISEKSIDRLVAVRAEVMNAVSRLDGIIETKDRALKLYANYLALKNKILTGENYGN